MPEFDVMTFPWRDRAPLCCVSSPYVIGTMTQGVSTSPNLELHHNFRFVVLFGLHKIPENT